MCRSIRCGDDPIFLVWNMSWWLEQNFKQGCLTRLIVLQCRSRWSLDSCSHMSTFFRPSVDVSKYPRETDAIGGYLYIGIVFQLMYTNTLGLFVGERVSYSNLTLLYTLHLFSVWLMVSYSIEIFSGLSILLFVTIGAQISQDGASCIAEYTMANRNHNLKRLDTYRHPKCRPQREWLIQISYRHVLEIPR